MIAFYNLIAKIMFFFYDASKTETLIEIFQEPHPEESEEGLERFSRLWEEIWEDSHGAQVWRVSLGLSGNDMESDTLTDTHITLT